MDLYGNGEKMDLSPTKDPLTGRFVVGHPGGPGRPKGSLSIKEELKRYLENNPEEKQRFIEHFAKKNRELGWQMLEGRPSQQVDLGVDKESMADLTNFFKYISGGNKKDDGRGDQSTGIPNSPETL